MKYIYSLVAVILFANSAVQAAETQLAEETKQSAQESKQSAEAKTEAHFNPEATKALQRDFLAYIAALREGHDATALASLAASMVNDIAQGADINAHYNHEPLLFWVIRWMSAMNGTAFQPALDFLLAHGASPAKSSGDPRDPKFTILHNTARELMRAVYEGATEKAATIMNSLLAGNNKGLVDIKDGKGRTPLMVLLQGLASVQSGEIPQHNKELVIELYLIKLQALLDNGASVVKVKDNAGRNALDYAANIPAALAILQAHVKINADRKAAVRTHQELIKAPIDITDLISEYDFNE